MSICQVVFQNKIHAMSYIGTDRALFFIIIRDLHFVVWCGRLPIEVKNE